MSPDQKPKSGQSQNWFQIVKLRLRDSLLHWPQVKLAADYLQASLPRDLGIALKNSMLHGSRDLFQDVYQNDLKNLGSAAQSGGLSWRNFTPDSTLIQGLRHEGMGHLARFWGILQSDLAERQTPQQKALYVLKVASLFASAGIGISAGANVAALSLGSFKRLRTRPWFASLSLVIASTLIARLLTQALAQLPEESPDRPLADFLRANFEIIAFGGSLGTLDIPSFVRESAVDPTLDHLGEWLREVMAEANPKPRPSDANED